MDELRLRALRDSHQKLRNGIIVDNILPEFVSCLRLTEVERSRIEAKSSFNIAQVDELLTILRTKDNWHFDGFCTVLERNGCEHWAKQLRAAANITEPNVDCDSDLEMEKDCFYYVEIEELDNAFYGVLRGVDTFVLEAKDTAFQRFRREAERVIRHRRHVTSPKVRLSRDRAEFLDEIQHKYALWVSNLEYRSLREVIMSCGDEGLIEQLQQYEDLLRAKGETIIYHCKKAKQENDGLYMKLKAKHETTLATLVRMQDFLVNKVGLDDAIFTGFREGCIELYFQLSPERENIPVDYLLSNACQSKFRQWEVSKVELSGHWVIDTASGKITYRKTSYNECLTEDSDSDLSADEARQYDCRHSEESKTKQPLLAMASPSKEAVLRLPSASQVEVQCGTVKTIASHVVRAKVKQEPKQTRWSSIFSWGCEMSSVLLLLSLFFIRILIELHSNRAPYLHKEVRYDRFTLRHLDVKVLHSVVCGDYLEYTTVSGIYHSILEDSIRLSSKSWHACAHLFQTASEEKWSTSRYGDCLFRRCGLLAEYHSTLFPEDADKISSHNLPCSDIHLVISHETDGRRQTRCLPVYISCCLGLTHVGTFENFYDAKGRWSGNVSDGVFLPEYAVLFLVAYFPANISPCGTCQPHHKLKVVKCSTFEVTGDTWCPYQGGPLSFTTDVPCSEKLPEMAIAPLLIPQSDFRHCIFIMPEQPLCRLNGNTLHKNCYFLQMTENETLVQVHLMKHNNRTQYIVTYSYNTEQNPQCPMLRANILNCTVGMTFWNLDSSAIGEPQNPQRNGASGVEYVMQEGGESAVVVLHPLLSGGRQVLDNSTQVCRDSTAVKSVYLLGCGSDIVEAQCVVVTISKVTTPPIRPELTQACVIPEKNKGTMDAAFCGLITAKDGVTSAEQIRKRLPQTGKGEP